MIEETDEIKELRKKLIKTIKEQDKNMKSVFIVLYSGLVSSEGYETVEKAIEFIEGRAGKPQKISNTSSWTYIDKWSNVYEIKKINII